MKRVFEHAKSCQNFDQSSSALNIIKISEDSIYQTLVLSERSFYKLFQSLWVCGPPGFQVIDW